MTFDSKTASLPAVMPQARPEQAPSSDLATSLTVSDRLPIQRSPLTIGAEDDPLEKEADDMADRVMRRADTCFVQRKCAKCEEEEPLQRKSLVPFAQRMAADGTPAVSAQTEANIRNTRGGGSPLPSPAKSFMESGFQRDFSHVKVHTGDYAVQLSKELNAQAFTVGSDIYFNQGKFQPESKEGQHLLAHELTHTVQQQTGLAKKVQRRSFYSSVPTGPGGITDYQAAYATLSPLNAVDMLDTLHELENRHPGSIFLLSAFLSLATGPIGATRLRIFFLGVINGRHQNRMTTAQMTDLATNITSLPQDQQQEILSYIRRHRSNVTQDLYRGTHLPTSAEQGTLETLFNPGTTTTVSSTGAVTVSAPTPDPVCANASSFGTRIRGVLEPQIRSGAAAFRTLQASPPSFPISQANSMADLAQQEVERYFRPYLARASRSASATYSLGGSYRASSMLRDQAATTQWRTEPGRIAWLRYWYNHHTSNMNDTLHCSRAEVDAAVGIMARDASLIPDIDAWINSWPAEATNGIHIQPYLNPSTLICQRWDTFTTIIHEFLHVLRHPNYTSATSQLSVTGLELLKEGIDDVLRKELWEGPGTLRSRLTSSSRNSDRAIIEGGTYPLNSSLVCNHGYYNNLSQAETIVSTVGRENVKLAYFLGQTEYLGLGNGTILEPGKSLAGLSFYQASHLTDMEHVAVLAGETRDQLLLRTNGTEIRDTSNAVVSAASPLPATVRIPGVRHVYVHTDDSLTSIAVQNGVTPYEIMRANNMTATNLTVGSRLLIPRH